MTMTLVSTVTVGSGGTASIEFANIPQTGKDLLVLISPRVAFSSAAEHIRLYFNNTSGIYSTRYLNGTGSAVSSASTSGQTFITLYNATPGATTTSNTFGNSEVYISNYASTTRNKPISANLVTENNATQAYQTTLAGHYDTTSAISYLYVEVNGTTFVQNTTVSLYIIS